MLKLLYEYAVRNVSLQEEGNSHWPNIVKDYKSELLMRLENIKFFFDQLLKDDSGIMVAVDQDGQFIYANETILKMLNVTWEDVEGKKILEFRKDYIPVFCSAIIEKKVMKRVKEFEGSRGKRFFDITAIPVMIGEVVIGVISLGTDVTETVLLERSLIDSERMFLIGQMAARIMHDIRNPLQIVKSSVQMMQLWNRTGELNQQKLGQMLKNIDTSVDNVIDLMNDMLQFSKPGTEPKEIVNLKDLLFKIGELFSSTFSKYRIAFSLNVINGCEIYGNKKLLRQGILNIVQNAVEVLQDYEGERKLEIRLWEEDQEGVIEIFNTGPLIEEVIKDRIFDTFFSTKGTQGTGLGLAITNEIVEQVHGGRIWCISGKENGGTSFMIQIPKNII